MASSLMETGAPTDQDRTSILLRFDRGQHVCPVTVAEGARATLGEHWQPTWTAAAVIGDASVIKLHGEEAAELLRPLAERVELLPFPAGEAHKTRATKERLEDRLIGEGFDRQCCIVALGGGITVDLAGFVAATFLRGVAHINLPTSLLAMVDAAVGGKTGVNTEHGKNLVGAVHQPAAVVIDPFYLSTLPASEWACGLAELVKHAVIADEDLFGWVEAHAEAVQGPPWRGGVFPLRRCVEIKGQIVEQDEREAGRRALLNYGHTVGHAVEKALGHGIDHGRAVAVGMLVEGRAALSCCGLPESELARLRVCLGRLGLPTRPPDLDFDSLIPFLAVDKKRRDHRLHLALPRRIGDMARSEGGRDTLPTDLALLREAWDEESRS